jgi:hypothetical protein
VARAFASSHHHIAGIAPLPDFGIATRWPVSAWGKKFIGYSDWWSYKMYSVKWHKAS